MFIDRGPQRDPARRLYIPNVDNGLELSDFVNGETGIKARQVMPRFLHYCNEGDGLVVSKKISDDYLEYLKELYGFAKLPHLFIAPNRNIHNAQIPYSILHDILCNEKLMSKLSEAGYEMEWEVTPFISHKWAHKLGRRIYRPVHGVSFDRVAAGHVMFFNDKVRFVRDCRVLRIPIPPGVIAKGWNDLIVKAEEKIQEYGNIILRVGRSGGGFGLCIVRKADLIQSHCDIKDYLEKEIPPESRKHWNEQEVLIEHYLPKKCSPSTLVYITDADIIRVIDTNQILDSQDHFLGACIPSGVEPQLLEMLWLYTEKSARYVQTNGGRGFYGVDWGILLDGSVVAFEPNYRFTGNWHIMCVRKKLAIPDSYVTMHKDKMPIFSKVTFSMLLEVLKKQGIIWDKERGDGVVVTIPPDGEIFGFCCIASDKTRAQQLFNEVEACTQSSQHILSNDP